MLYINHTDSATILADSTAGNYDRNNLKNDLKGLVHRSLQKSIVYTLTWDSAKTLNSIILPYTNLTKTATVTLGFYTEAADTSATYTYTTTVKQYDTATPLLDITVPSNSAYSYGGGRCVSIWSDAWATPTVTCKKLTITISDSANPQPYIEVSRILCGTYWSPAYNTKFGIQVTHNDQSEHNRTEAGNLVTTNKTMFKTMNFELEWLPPADRTDFINIVKTIGIRKPLFVSVFPESSDPSIENEYEIYGKFTASPTITHPMFTVYATSVSLEEI
jgi:hypothetical protein